MSRLYDPNGPQCGREESFGYKFQLMANDNTLFNKYKLNSRLVLDLTETDKTILAQK